MPVTRRVPVSVAMLAAVVLPAAAPAVVVAPDEVPDRGPVLSEPIERGSLVLDATTTRAPSVRTVDGDPSDWIGAASGISGTTVWDAGEHIHSDFLFDAHGADDGGDAARLADFAELFYAETRTWRIDQLLRTSGSQLGVPEPVGADDEYGDQPGGLDEADLREVRWGADATGQGLQLLVRLANATDPSRLGVLVLADRDGEGGPVGFGTDLTATRFDRAVMLTGAGVVARDLATDLDVAADGRVRIDVDGWTNTLEAGLPADLLTTAGGDSFDVSVITGRFGEDGAFVPLNIAYRHAEPLEIFNDRLQALDLHGGTVDRFSSGPIAVADLVGGRSEPMLRPGPGYHERHLRSGEDISREQGQHGIWQPYGVYVPTGYEPGSPTPTTFWLHYRGGKAHSGVVINPRLVTQLGEEPTNLMVFPHARGTSEWYVTESHQDFFEVLDDVHGLLPDIDPTRRYLSGYSMGGYGSWLLGTLYPDLFAAAFVQSGAVTQGAWLGGGPDDEPDPFLDQGWIEANDGDARAQLTYRALENLRHVPVAIDHGTDDELVPVTGIERMAARLTELGYPHRFTRLVGYEHFTQAIVDEWADGAAFLQRHRAPTDPREVTYAVVPALVWAVNAIDPPAEATFDFAPDGAYWVDDVVVREVAISDEERARPDPSVEGLVELTAEALAAPATVTVPDPGVASPPGHSTPYVRTGLQDVAVEDPTGALTPALANRFSGTLANVASVSLDAGRMGLDLSEATGAGFGFELTVDGPTTIRLVDAAAGGRTLFDDAPRSFPDGVHVDRDGTDVVITLAGAGTYAFAALS
ncbi:MAG: prolyl oligopeptidase family serine peptidase [Actinobacteria bacterium]|nr:prolyl oligopeptidase family serine peptidase [Actinomycetota bacterium]